MSGFSAEELASVYRMHDDGDDESAAEAAARAAPAASAAAAVSVPRKRKAVAAATPQSERPGNPVRFDQQVVREALAERPILELMPDLIRDYPHTAQDTACTHALSKLTAHHQALKPERPAAAAAAAAFPLVPPLKSNTLLRSSLHFEASQCIPGMAKILELYARVERMTPTYRHPGQVTLPSPHDVAHGLRSDYISLPTFTAMHESNLLRAAGPRVYPAFKTSTGVDIPARTVVYPPCVMGHQCVGFEGRQVAPGESSYIQGLTERIVLMRAMTPAQWHTLETQGIAPPGNSPCVLCHRQSLCEFVHHVRFMNSITVRIESNGEVAQLWQNKVDCAEGYFDKYILKPSELREVVVAPIAEMARWPLRAFRDNQGHWRIDQTPMVWKSKAPLQPEVGESLRNF